LGHLQDKSLRDNYTFEVSLNTVHSTSNRLLPYQKLLNVIKKAWLKEAVMFTVLTGLRRGELINLRWQDVDLDRRVFTVQSNPTFKTKQERRRVLPLNEMAFNLLALKHSQSIEEYVFTI
jgi:integrase